MHRWIIAAAVMLVFVAIASARNQGTSSSRSGRSVSSGQAVYSKTKATSISSGYVGSKYGPDNTKGYTPPTRPPATKRY
jgi:hypothetical protein